MVAWHPQPSRTLDSECIRRWWVRVIIRVNTCFTSPCSHPGVTALCLYRKPIFHYVVSASHVRTHQILTSAGSTTVNDIKVENKIGDAIVQRIIRAHRERTPWKCCIIIPLLPGFPFPVEHSDASAVSLRRLVIYFCGTYAT